MPSSIAPDIVVMEIRLALCYSFVLVYKVCYSCFTWTHWTRDGTSCNIEQIFRALIECIDPIGMLLANVPVSLPIYGLVKLPSLLCATIQRLCGQVLLGIHCSKHLHRVGTFDHAKKWCGRRKQPSKCCTCTQEWIQVQSFA